MMLILSLIQEAIEPPTPALLDPKAGLFIWTLVVFGIVLFILRKYAWGPIINALNTREQTITESIKRAEKALDEARQISSDNEKARREADLEAQRILREARDAAEALRTDEVEKTRAEIQQLQQQVQAEIEREKQAALSTLRAEVADLAIQAAEKILNENLDPGRNRKLVESFIEGLPKN
jgi:F-type H+-transporting ATPase subunit b